MKAVRCPICDGEGRCFSGFLVSNCHGCGGTENQRGRGWVEVHDDPTFLTITGYITGCEDCIIEKQRLG